MHHPLLDNASLVMLLLSCCATPFTSRHPSLVALHLSCRLYPYKSPSTLPGMHPNKVGCCVIKRCIAPTLVPPLLSCCLSLFAPHPSRHVIPLLLCFASLLSCCLSPLSLPLSSLFASLVAPHHSPLCQEQDWLLCNKTVHHRLTTSLCAPTAKNSASPPPHHARCTAVSIVMLSLSCPPHPSCHTIPLLLCHASLVAPLSWFMSMIDSSDAVLITATKGRKDVDVKSAIEETR